MPTKRQFDMTVLVVGLSIPVVGLFRMWAARRVQTENEGLAGRVLSGAVRIFA